MNAPDVMHALVRASGLVGEARACEDGEHALMQAERLLFGLIVAVEEAVGASADAYGARQFLPHDWRQGAAGAHP